MIVYSLKTCPYCTDLKEGLDKEGIKYEDRDVDNPKYNAEFEHISKLSGDDSIPVMVIGKEVFVPDISFNSIEEGIILAKKFNQS